MSNVVYEKTHWEKTDTVAPRTISQIADDLGYSSDWHWAWDNYKTMILELARDGERRRHLEIGAGRDPLFVPSEAVQYGFDVTLNDISFAELALAPNGYGKIACDITAPAAPSILGEGKFDLAYCRMVMEHVPDVEAMWRTVHAVLAPGGVALSFFPTLYAPPYALNRLLPERVSRWMLETVFPQRKPDGDDPKFPAYYNHCFSDEKKIVPMLTAAGFSEITVLPFWGYSYFWKFPGIKQIDAAFTQAARKRDWRIVSSFAYVIAKK